MKIVKLTVTLKNERVIKLGKKTMTLSRLFRNEIIEIIDKTEAISISERESLTKVKVKKSHEEYLNFANLSIQEFCDDMELDMMMLMQCCMLVQKQLNLNLKLNRKRKENLIKIKNQIGKLILKRKLKR